MQMKNKCFRRKVVILKCHKILIFTCTSMKARKKKKIVKL